MTDAPMTNRMDAVSADGSSHGRHFPSLVAALRDPARYPAGDFPGGTERPAQVELLETHISCVFLAGQHAYKLKKPVDLGFLNFTALESRRFYCEEELRLNRRTAPELYLEVVPITGTHADPRVGGPGSPIDYAVKMRAFAQDALLDHLVREGRLEASTMDALGLAVAQFHEALPAADAAPLYGSAQQVLANALQNFDQMRAQPDPAADAGTLEALRRWTLREHASVRRLFTSRRDGGFVRECHGDLHLGNIVLLDGRPVPFDCLEFDPSFRWIDVMDEVAFLVMDLREHGHPDLAARFLNRYLETTGDYAGLRVLRFYTVYRAVVRAKVTRIRLHQPGVDSSTAAGLARKCSGYLEFARHATVRKRGAMILMHGPSGSGKTTVARALADALQAIHLRSDVERKRLFGLGALDTTGSELGTGVYAAQGTEATYARLGKLAGGAIDAGYRVIVDATFLAAAQRAVFRRAALARNVPFTIVSCDAPEEVLRERIAARKAHGEDASEAGFEVLEHQLESLEPLGDEESAYVVRVDWRNPADSARVAASLVSARLGRRPGRRAW